MSKIDIENLKLKSLTNENLQIVHEMCEENVNYVSLSLETFKKHTLLSKMFDPNFSIIAFNEKSEVLAFFMIVFREPYLFKKSRKIAVLKFFVVHKLWRNRGLGSYLLDYLMKKIENSTDKCFRMKLEVMTSMPDYLFPGLDPRHTKAFFFLKKNGFKKKGDRINLIADLETTSDAQPINKIDNIIIDRARVSDKKKLTSLSFMPYHYRKSFWPAEISLSFDNEPISTFIAKDIKTNRIIGWGSHSIQFPGSFGPTGVEKNNRGKGIGRLLLLWCLWDIKNNINKEKTIIIWVPENTAYFYSKSVEAEIYRIYWKMKKRF